MKTLLPFLAFLLVCAPFTFAQDRQPWTIEVTVIKNNEANKKTEVYSAPFRPELDATIPIDSNEFGFCALTVGARKENSFNPSLEKKSPAEYRTVIFSLTQFSGESPRQIYNVLLPLSFGKEIQIYKSPTTTFSAKISKPEEKE